MLYIIVLLFAVHTKFIAKIDENSNHLPSDDSLVTSLVTQNCEKDIKIQQLLKSLEEQTLYSKHIKLENDKIKNENEKLKNNKAEALLRKSFNYDQIRKLNSSANHQGWRWSNGSIEKAIRTRLACGYTGYNYLIRELRYPLPSIRTTNRRLENLKLAPGNY